MITQENLCYAHTCMYCNLTEKMDIVKRGLGSVMIYNSLAHFELSLFCRSTLSLSPNLHDGLKCVITNDIYLFGDKVHAILFDTILGT